MKDLLQILRNGLIAVVVVMGGLFLLASLIAPPKIVALNVSNVRGADVRYTGMPLFPAADGANFLYMGQSKVFVTAPGHELTEIQFDSEAAVFRGNADVKKWLGFLFLVDVRLTPQDPNLKIVRYEGVLTAGGDASPQVLPLHPRLRGMHQPLDDLKRQYENRTGRPFSSIPYLQLQLEDDGSVFLDFSGADGGGLVHWPPAGWSAGNLLVRILYSMTSPPAEGYVTRLPVAARQADTPYEIGSTFFYCRFAGYYCAGRVTTFHNSRGYQQASVELWHNALQGDNRLRYE